MAKLWTIIFIAAVMILVYLYGQGNDTVVNAVQSVYGSIADLTTPAEEEIQWEFMLDFQGFPYTCSDNQQCADVYSLQTEAPASVAQSNTRCHNLRCEYAASVT